MGCDIHVMGEKRIYPDEKNRDSGIWVSIDKWIVNQDKIRYPEDYKDAPDMEIDYQERLYKGRNYFLFHILADVRGNPEWGPIISEPKGIPHDCCKEINREIESWDSDGHSHSYLTLAELLEFDWNAKAEDEKIFRNNDELDLFLHKTPAEDIMSQSSRKTGDYEIFNVTYMRPYKDFFPDFMETMKKMSESLEEYCGETNNDVRLVFFFDN